MVPSDAAPDSAAPDPTTTAPGSTLGSPADGLDVDQAVNRRREQANASRLAPPRRVSDSNDQETKSILGHDSADAPHVEWGIPVEMPWSVLRTMIEHGADASAVVVCDGVVLHAPGEMNLGRSTRLASRAQRRALRALHPHCVMPGCAVGFDHTQPHHVVWWERGGPTDLDNLVPLCSRHHHLVHTDGWHLHLHPDRQVTITDPDGRHLVVPPPGCGYPTNHRRVTEAA